MVDPRSTFGQYSEEHFQDANTGVLQLRTILASYEQDVEQKNTPKLPEAENHGEKILDPKMRARSFEARNERTVTGTPAKSRSTGKSVSVERKQGDCCHLKAKGKCTKGDACSVRHNESKRERITSFSSPTPKWQTNNDVNNSSKGTPPRGSSPSGKRLRRRGKDYLSVSCTNPSCPSWRPPVC